MSAARPGAPAELARIIDRALVKSPDHRYQGAADLAADLRSLLDTFERKASGEKGTATKAQPSIAVLPFANMSADPEQEYFCDGMADEIINALAQLDGLRVVARTSAFAFKGQRLDVREVGKRLSVGTLLEGSVRRAGNRLRITAQLIDVADGYHLWSERYDRDVEDVFAIQDEISLAIVDKLKIRLLGKDRGAIAGRHTEDLEAYNLYLKGRYHWNKRVPEEVRKGLECFRQAIERDPNYAAAYAGLADCYLVLENMGELEPEEAFREADAAVARALELDGNLAEAHASLGWIKMVRDGDWDEAERELLRAIELNPSYSTARQWYAIHRMAVGRLYDGLAEATRAQRLDPLSPMIGVVVGLMLSSVGEYERAAEQLRKTLEIDPMFIPAHTGLSETYLARGMYEEAFAEIEKTASLPGGEKWHATTLGYAYAVAGKRDEAFQLLDDLDSATEGAPPPPITVAEIYAALGEEDRALELLEKACETRSSQMLFILTSRAFDDLRSHHRFAALLKKIGVRG